MNNALWKKQHLACLDEGTRNSGAEEVMKEEKPEREMQREEEEDTKLRWKVFVLSPWLECELLVASTRQWQQLRLFGSTQLPCVACFPHTLVFSSRWSERQVLLFSPFTDGETKAQRVKQFALQDRGGMGHLLTQAHCALCTRRGMWSVSHQLSQCSQD